MSEEIEAAQKEMQEARAKLRTSPVGLAGSGAEVAYATAYQKLVKLGLALQIKAKYRNS